LFGKGPSLRFTQTAADPSDEAAPIGIHMPTTETRDQINPELAAAICSLLARIFQEDISREWSDRPKIKSLRKYALNGDISAQIWLGSIYYFGNGAPRDYARAREWFLKAAAFEVAEAESFLGRLYANGYGVCQDFGEAAAWFEKAAAQDCRMSQSALGFLYAEGAGVPKDEAQAAAWFRRAAEVGEVFAQSSLGMMNAYGMGVPQDFAEAAKWFQRSADKGHAGAQAHLCLLYAHGLGVVQDYTEAARWYEKCHQIDPDAAQFALDSLPSEGRAEDSVQDVAAALRATRSNGPLPGFSLAVASTPVPLLPNIPT
jgi:TPR repeat protein